MPPAYAQKVIDSLPKSAPIRKAATALAALLQANEPGDIDPDPGESVPAWINSAHEQSSTPRRIRLVLGESRGDHRGNRDECDDGGMVRAASSDGGAGSELIFGLSRALPAGPGTVDFQFLIDEWEETTAEVACSDLLVIGTGEVNILAAFLERLVRTHTQIPGLADRLRYRVGVESWHPISRDTGGSGQSTHPGAVLLLKNPWDLRRRVLWVAGLTGVATGNGVRLLFSDSAEYRQNVPTSIGVVYRNGARNVPATPVAWLRRTTDECVWQQAFAQPSTRTDEPNQPREPDEHRKLRELRELIEQAQESDWVALADAAKRTGEKSMDTLKNYMQPKFQGQGMYCRLPDKSAGCTVDGWVWRKVEGQYQFLSSTLPPE